MYMAVAHRAGGKRVSIHKIRQIPRLRNRLDPAVLHTRYEDTIRHRMTRATGLDKPLPRAINRSKVVGASDLLEFSYPHGQIWRLVVLHRKQC